MCQLYAGLGTLAVNEVDDANPAVALCVVPNAGAFGGDARLGADARRLHHYEAGTPGRVGAGVHEVPVMGHAVAFEAHVLAHRRDPNPVTEGNAPDRQRFEKTWGHGRDGPFLTAFAAGRRCRPRVPSTLRCSSIAGERRRCRNPLESGRSATDRLDRNRGRGGRSIAPKSPHRCTTSVEALRADSLQGRSTTSNSSRSAPVATGSRPSATGLWSAVFARQASKDS